MVRYSGKKGHRMKQVLILGASGNGLFIADMINQTFRKGLTDYECVGFVSDNLDEYQGFPVIGGFDKIETIKRDYYFIPAISVDCRPGRRELFRRLSIPPERFATFIHPTSFISANVTIAPGVIIAQNVSINTATYIEEGVRIMSNASIGASCRIGCYSFVSVNSCLADFCNLEPGCHIGLSSVVSQGVTVGDSSLLGIGSFLQKSVKGNEIWAGNPAKFLKFRY
jgi:sugar O-acyltransferase (sialic acid O-acetyltransferase NeuD family)